MRMLAGEPLSADGKVVDESGASVEGEIVLAERPGGSRKLGALTGKNGEFHIEGLLPGEYVFTVEEEGDASGQITAPAGSSGLLIVLHRKNSGGGQGKGD